jgi:predicted SprT family Zn-dependent metalloprotease
VTFPLTFSTEKPSFHEVRQIAVGLLALHGLHEWSFAFNWRKRSMGLCSFGHRRIEISVHFVKRNAQAEILDTLLHEIAHALVGPDRGHDATWKSKCVEIGARLVRCGDADMPKGRWQAGCKGCGTQY